MAEKYDRALRRSDLPFSTSMLTIHLAQNANVDSAWASVSPFSCHFYSGTMLFVRIVATTNFHIFAGVFSPLMICNRFDTMWKFLSLTHHKSLLHYLVYYLLLVLPINKLFININNEINTNATFTHIRINNLNNWDNHTRDTIIFV